MTLPASLCMEPELGTTFPEDPHYSTSQHSYIEINVDSLKYIYSRFAKSIHFKTIEVVVALN